MRTREMRALAILGLAMGISGRVAGAQTVPAIGAKPKGQQGVPSTSNPNATPRIIPPAVPFPGGKLEDRYRSAAEVKARFEWEQEHYIQFPRVVRGNPAVKEIALTFDDGPHPLFTQQILDILNREKITATFFVIGANVDAHPDLVQQAAAQGIEIANHTYHHIRLPTLASKDIVSELKNGALAIERAIGYSTRIYRPPGGEYDIDTINATRELGYTMVLWTDDPGDYADPGTRIIENRVLRDVSSGGILLLHDGATQTVQILPDLIQKLKARGYRFVTCSAMARERGVITTGGPQVLPPVPHRPPMPIIPREP